MSHRVDNLADILADTDKLINALNTKSNCHHGKPLKLDVIYQDALKFLAPHHTKQERKALLLTSLFDQGYSAEEILEFIIHIPDIEIKKYLIGIFDDYFEASKKFPAYNRLKDMLDVLVKYPLSEIPNILKSGPPSGNTTKIKIASNTPVAELEVQ